MADRFFDGQIGLIFWTDGYLDGRFQKKFLTDCKTKFLTDCFSADFGRISGPILAIFGNFGANFGSFGANFGQNRAFSLADMDFFLG